MNKNKIIKGMIPEFCNSNISIRDDIDWTKFTFKMNTKELEEHRHWDIVTPYAFGMHYFYRDKFLRHIVNTHGNFFHKYIFKLVEKHYKLAKYLKWFLPQQIIKQDDDSFYHVKFRGKEYEIQDYKKHLIITSACS